MKLVFFTGAGISVSAGLPTYRGKDGKYTPGSANFVPPVVVDDRLSFIDFVHACDSIRGLRPELEAVEPTDAHRVIAELEADHEIVVITQNIDNLHKRAGSTNVIELHGNVFEEYYDEDFKIERPNVVFFGEQLNVNTFNRGWDAVDDFDYFVSIGTSAQVYPAAAIMEKALELRFRFPNNHKAFHIDPARPELDLIGARHIQLPADEGIKDILTSIRAEA